MYPDVPREKATKQNTNKTTITKYENIKSTNYTTQLYRLSSVLLPPESPNGFGPSWNNITPCPGNPSYLDGTT
jgi:hypothetical protein